MQKSDGYLIVIATESITDAIVLIIATRQNLIAKSSKKTYLLEAVY